MAVNVVLVTILAGNIIGSATTGSLSECVEMRDRVMSVQKDVSAYCTYEDKPTTPDEALELVRKWMQLFRETHTLDELVEVPDCELFGDPDPRCPAKPERESLDWQKM